MFQQSPERLFSALKSARVNAESFFFFFAQARQIAYSLIQNKRLEPVDMAKRFWKEHSKEPWRGYGANVAQVFLGLSQNLERDSGTVNSQYLNSKLVGVFSSP